MGCAILELEMDLEGDELLDGTCENSIVFWSTGANTAMASTISGAPKLWECHPRIGNGFGGR